MVINNHFIDSNWFYSGIMKNYKKLYILIKANILTNCLKKYDYDYDIILLRHTISTIYHATLIFKSCKKNIIYYNDVCHRRTNKESVLSADVGPPETKIINKSKCTSNMSIYIIIGD